MQKQRIKEWYEKKDILKIYPIGITTYKKRIRRLNTPELIQYTRFIRRELPGSNLKHIQVREIHFSILDELFGKIRTPSLKNIHKIISWVNNQKWNWIGNIVPSKTYPIELKRKMEFLFSHLKKTLKNNSGLTLFYSIEKNTQDDYFHSHFLISETDCQIEKETILKQLELIAEENNAKEKRIYLKEYDFKNFGKSGADYSVKELNYGFDVLK